MGNNGEHPRAPGFDHAAVALSAHNGSCLLDQTRVHNFCQRYVHKRERNVCVSRSRLLFTHRSCTSRPFMPYNIRSRIIRVICVFIERRIITTLPLRILDRTVKAVKRYLKYCRIDFNISCLRLFTIFFLFFFFFKLRTRLDTRAYYI